MSSRPISWQQLVSIYGLACEEEGIEPPSGDELLALLIAASETPEDAVGDFVTWLH